MAKICSSYGSSPITNTFFTEWMLNAYDELSSTDLCNNDYNPIKSELFEDLNYGHSIYADIKLLEADTFPGDDAFDLDIKPEIEHKNIEIMWSGNGAVNSSNSAASSLNDSVTATAVPLSAVTGHHVEPTATTAAKQQQQNSQITAPVVVVANNAKFQLNKLALKTYIKSEPHNDDYEQALQQHSIPTKTVASYNSMQNIPPGTSLLRQQRKKPIQIPNMGASEFVRERDNGCNSLTHNSYGRPDTPHSLDDDAHQSAGSIEEFKSKVDVSACLMGSNNISLTSTDPLNYIHHVSQVLQDNSKNINLGSSACSLSEVMDVLEDISVNDVKHNMEGSSTSGYSSSSSSSLNYSGFNANMQKSLGDSETEEEDEIEEEEEENGSMMDGSCYSESADGSFMLSSPVPSRTSSSGGSSSSSSHHQGYLHSDHSYTRCKDGVDEMGANLDTPSDSGKFLVFIISLDCEILKKIQSYIKNTCDTFLNMHHFLNILRFC